MHIENGLETVWFPRAYRPLSGQENRCNRPVIASMLGKLCPSWVRRQMSRLGYRLLDLGSEPVSVGTIQARLDALNGGGQLIKLKWRLDRTRTVVIRAGRPGQQIVVTATGAIEYHAIERGAAWCITRR